MLQTPSLNTYKSQTGLCQPIQLLQHSASTTELLTPESLCRMGKRSFLQEELNSILFLASSLKAESLACCCHLLLSSEKRTAGVSTSTLFWQLQSQPTGVSVLISHRYKHYSIHLKNMGKEILGLFPCIQTPYFRCLRSV